MDKEYDNTNSGVMFPAGSMDIIRQGKIDIEGFDHNLILVKCVTKKGNTVYEIHKQVGVAFVAGEDKDFDAQGNLDVGNGEYTIWLRKKTSQNGNPITVASLSPKKETATESTENMPVVDSTPDLDDIPF